MAWFSRRYDPAQKPVAQWGNPRSNYADLASVAWGSPQVGGYVMPMAVPVWPLVTAVRGAIPTTGAIPQNFPSPLTLFNKPRNIFGSG